MKIRFKATECGTQVNGRVLTVGASNSKSEDEYHYIAMQALIDPKTEQDMAIHFEIDDQINGNYDLLKSCECTDCDSNPPPQRGKVVSGPPILEVDLASARADYPELVAGLRQMFQNRPHKLTIAAEPLSSPRRQ